MAVSGEDFCTSGWNALMLNMAFGIEFIWAMQLASWFMGAGVLFIVGMNCLTFHGFLSVTGENE